ncbi:hypothetical protein SMD11_1253 [Streptomyces albireticuli]|uniref:Uncharacterized protein n=1 Tax=Streptomyces albireticuli TaxID=1940 RepID=A0A1Z2KXZ4_9ACTN|nr:hypothetical protein SMD11_1253 [Streptomyces albireticuli]
MTDHLIARVSDAAEIANFLFIKANSDETDVRLPEPIPRPGQVEMVKPRDPAFAEGAEISAFFTQMSNL